MAVLREIEFRAAAEILGLQDVVIFEYPDGKLQSSDVPGLVLHIDEALDEADLIVVFDQGGITGHRDHQRATEAALSCGRKNGVAVLAWTVSVDVAKQLNAEFGAGFVGRPTEEIDFELVVDRTKQIEAIRCHESQSNENPVLWRRLELQADREYLRYLIPPKGNG